MEVKNDPLNKSSGKAIAIAIVMLAVFAAMGIVLGYSLAALWGASI